LAAHDLSRFDSGELVLDDWLRRRAQQNEASGASRTYAVCSGRRVVGYYTLAVGAIDHAQTPGRVRRNMADPVPAHAISERAKRFYETYGFVASPVDPMTVMIKVAEAVRILGEKEGT
jgi:hypothetical protein